MIEAHRALREAGRVFFGRDAVLAVSFVQRARSYEVRFGVIPTFAAKARAVREGFDVSSGTSETGTTRRSSDCAAA